jgi:hypothetical protein
MFAGVQILHIVSTLTEFAATGDVLPNLRIFSSASKHCSQSRNGWAAVQQVKSRQYRETDRQPFLHYLQARPT